MNREEIREELRKNILEVMDQSGELLTMEQIKSWLDENYGLGDEAYEFMISILSK